MKKEYSTTFEEIWKEWNLKKKRDNKWAAYLKFRTIERKEPEEIDLLKKWVQNQRFDCDNKYIPRLATVLYQRRWQDDDGQTPDIIEAEKQWEQLMTFIKRKGAGSLEPTPLNEKGISVLRKMGGRRTIGYANMKSIPKLRSTFIEMFVSYQFLLVFFYGII